MEQLERLLLHPRVMPIMASLLRGWVRLRRLLSPPDPPPADGAAGPSPEAMVTQMFEQLLEQDPEPSGCLQLRHFRAVLPGFDEDTFTAVLGMTGSDAEVGISLDALKSVYLDLELSDLRADYSSYMGVELDAAPAAETAAALEDPAAIAWEEMGWHPSLGLSHDSPEVAALRSQLEAGGGLLADEHGAQRPVEIVDPSEPGFAARAAALLRRDGHGKPKPSSRAAWPAWRQLVLSRKPSPSTPLLAVVVKDVLDEARLATVRAGVERVVREIIARDPDRLGNRGSHRYSIGSAAEAFGETAAWSALVDPPPLLEVMAAVFGDEELQCGGCTGGECVFSFCSLLSSACCVPSVLSSAFQQQPLPASRLRAIVAC